MTTTYRYYPDEILSRDHWQGAAALLVEHWFEQAFRKSWDLANVAHAMYQHALFWLPIVQQRCPGTRRPSWTVPVILSWIRRAISPATRQYFCVQYNLIEPDLLGRAIANALEIPGIRPHHSEWISESLDFLFQLSRTGNSTSITPSRILHNLALLHHDRDLNEILAWRANGAARRLLRAQGMGTASYFRDGRTVYLFADAGAKSRHPELAWHDLREGPIRFLHDYILRYNPLGRKGKGGVEITLGNDVITQVKAEIAAVTSAHTNANHKIYLMQRCLNAFGARYRYAPHAWMQYVDVARFAKAKLKKVKAQLPKGNEAGLALPRTTNELVAPSPNPYLDPTLTEERWYWLHCPYA